MQEPQQKPKEPPKEPKEPPKEKPKEPPKEPPKEKPKEPPKEKPKEPPKEPPKEKPKEPPKEKPKEPPKPPPKPPPPPKKPTARARKSGGSPDADVSVVCTCDQAEDLGPVVGRDDPPIRLWNGTLLHRVERSGRARLIVQLPACYAPAGILRDFEGGVRMPVCPLTGDGRDSLARLHGVCRRLLLDAVHGGGGGASLDGASLEDSDWASSSSANPVRASGEAAILRNRRENDCALFAPDGTPLDDDTGLGVLPGETVIPIVCIEHVWVRPATASCAVRVGDPHAWPSPSPRREIPDAGRDIPTRPVAAGITLKLLQVLVVTERGRFRGMMLADPAGITILRHSGEAAFTSRYPADRPSGAGKSRRETAAARSAVSWVPSVSDIASAISRLRSTAKA